MSRKIAIVFPGQGSQSIGMLSDLANEFPQIREVFYQAAEVLNYDLWSLAQSGPEEQLNQTEFTQPLLLTAGVAMWQTWQSQCDIEPAFFAGHSLGEYSALVCATALEFSDTLRLVQERGQLMQRAFPTGGAMLAIIGLSEQIINEICHTAANGQILAPANYNSVGQTVLAGELTAIKRAEESAKKAGAKLVKILPVSVPAHCPLMQPVVEQLRPKLATINLAAPKIPVINNVDVACYSEPDKIRDALLRQLVKPVRWVEIIQFLQQNDVTNIIESGPGKVLTGLNKRIAEKSQCDFIGSVQNFKNVMLAMQN